METTRLRPEDRSPEVAGIRQQVLALVDTLEPATAAAIAGGDAVLELVASLEPDATVASCVWHRPCRSWPASMPCRPLPACPGGQDFPVHRRKACAA